MTDDQSSPTPVEDLPMLTQERGSALLDDVIHSALQFKDENGDETKLSTAEKLAVAFGDKAQVVAHLILLAGARGFDYGQVAATPASDRADLLVRAIRKIHVKEMFGDCAEDGDHFPCRSIRAAEIVGGPAPKESDDPFDSIVAGFES